METNEKGRDFEYGDDSLTNKTNVTGFLTSVTNFAHF